MIILGGLHFVRGAGHFGAVNLAADGTAIMKSSIIGNLSSGIYNGDGTSDIAVFRESSGMWSVRNLTRAYSGSTGDLPVTR